MQTRVIVIFPQLAPEHPIHDLRRRFDPLADAVPPHITLVFPFDSPITCEDLQQHMTQVAQYVPSFEVQLKQITGQNNEYLFLNVKRGNDEIIELHDRLYTGPLVPHFVVELTYTPHLTVGRLPNQAAFRAALHQARQADITLQMVVDTITVYQIESDEKRFIECSVQLPKRS